MPKQKTYWHLLKQRRLPTEYEIVTSKLLCYTGEGFTGKRFELDVPLKDWYRQYQQESPLVCSSWEEFRDPRETTYTKYTDLQRGKEIFVDEILDEIELTGYDAHLRPAWLHIFPKVVAPFRYPGHGFQMIASYIGQMAPSGRITIAAALQSAERCAAFSGSLIASGNFSKSTLGLGPTAELCGKQTRCGNPCVKSSKNCSSPMIGQNLSSD